MLNLSNLGVITLWLVFSHHLSNTSKSAGKIVKTVITPRSTPFAITIPKSLPKVRLIVHNTRNPAMVVVELPITEVNVSFIASFMASSFFILPFLLS